MERNITSTSLSPVAQALPAPEHFAAVWNEGTRRHRWPTWVALFAAAVLGAFAYGMTTGVLGGASEVLYQGLACTGAAGLAWGVPLYALKAKAAAAVSLVGILPVYVAASLGVMVFHVPMVVRTDFLLLGLLLPFIAGLLGTYSLYQGFLTFRETLPHCRRDLRLCFLRRLVLSWCVIYTAVCPVMIHAVWSSLGT